MKISLPSVGGRHPIHWGPAWNKKEEEGGIRSPCLSWDIRLLLPSDIHFPGSVGTFTIITPSSAASLVLTISGSVWPKPPAHLVFHFVDCKSWDFLVPKTTWANSYNKSFLMYVSLQILLFLSLWRTTIDDLGLYLHGGRQLELGGHRGLLNTHSLTPWLFDLLSLVP